MSAHRSCPQLGRGALILCGASSTWRNQSCVGLSWEMRLRAHNSYIPIPNRGQWLLLLLQSMGSWCLTVHSQHFSFVFLFGFYFTVVGILALFCCCFSFFNCFLPSSTLHSFGIGLPLTSCSQFLHPFCFSVPHYHNIDSKDILFLAGGFPRPLNTFNKNTFLSLSYLGENLIYLYFSQNSYWPIYHPQTAEVWFLEWF